MCSSYFLPISTLQIAMHLLPWDHPYSTSPNWLGGLAKYVAIFADVQYSHYYFTRLNFKKMESL